MTDGDVFDERDDRPELTAAIEELRSLLRSFDEVAPAEIHDTTGDVQQVDLGAVG